jgi:hypothetical protein
MFPEQLVIRRVNTSPVMAKKWFAQVLPMPRPLHVARFLVAADFGGLVRDT